jgi:hypothetical protein
MDGKAMARQAQEQRAQNVIEILQKPCERRTHRDLELIVPIIRDIEFFRERRITKEKELMDIAKRLKHETLPAGTAVIKHGKTSRRIISD